MKFNSAIQSPHVHRPPTPSGPAGSPRDRSRPNRPRANNRRQANSYSRSPVCTASVGIGRYPLRSGRSADAAPSLRASLAVTWNDDALHDRLPRLLLHWQQTINAASPYAQRLSKGRKGEKGKEMGRKGNGLTQKNNVRETMATEPGFQTRMYTDSARDGSPSCALEWVTTGCASRPDRGLA